MAPRSEAPRALVTGSAGFTGRYLRAELERAGYVVHGLAHHVTGHERDHAVDLRDPAALRRLVAEVRPDVVAHLGAITFVPHGDAFEIYQVNVFGTLNLLEALDGEKVAPRAVLLASTANVYGTPERDVLDESVCPAPVNHYATSKLAMEHMARTYADRLPIVITRPFNYTGVGQEAKFLVPKIVGHFRERKPLIELGNLDVERDFSDVRDVARIYGRLLETDAAIGQTVNIASGRGFALRRIVDELSARTGHAIEVRVNPAFVRANEIPRLVGSTAKLEAIVGAMERTSFEETLGWMVGAESSAMR